MSEADRESLLKIAGSRFAKEPFLHVVIMLVIASVVYLAHVGKMEGIPWVVGCGLGSILIAGIGIIIQWIAGRLESVTSSFEEMAKAYPILANNQRVVTQFVVAMSDEFAKKRHTLLLVEDNNIEQRLIREVLAPVMNEYDLTFVLATTLREGIALIRHAAVAVFDVSLEDNVSTESINMLIELLNGQCPVVINSHTEFSMSTFPQAEAVVLKGDAKNDKALMEAVRTALRKLPGNSKRFPAPRDLAEMG